MTQANTQIDQDAQDAISNLPPEEQKWLAEALEGKHPEYVSGEVEPLPLPESRDMGFNPPEYGDQIDPNKLKGTLGQVGKQPAQQQQQGQQQQGTQQQQGQPDPSQQNQQQQVQQGTEQQSQQPDPSQQQQGTETTTQQPDPRDARLHELVDENYRLRQGQRKNQDAADVNAFTQQVKTNMAGTNKYTQEQIDEVAGAFTTREENHRESLRFVDSIRDAAFQAGRNFGLSMDQVETLANSPSVNDFKATFEGFRSSAPTAETLALQNELNSVKKELAEVKQQVVPPGQQFGNMQGQSVPGDQQPDPNTFYSKLLSGELGYEDDVLAQADKFLGFK